MTIKLQKSYYEASVQRPPLTAPLQTDIKADICIIGGGFTAINCALTLADKNYKVVVLEAQAIGWGASGRNGGQCLLGYSTDQLQTVAKQGGVSEKWLFDISWQAVQMVKDNIKKYNIDCDWQSGFAEAATKPADFEHIKKYVDKLHNVYDYHNATVVDAVSLREIIASRCYYGGLLDDFSGHLHPLKLLLGLAQKATERGVQIHEQTAATKIERMGSGYKIHTHNGTVSCDNAVVACNAYHDYLLPKTNTRVMPVGTYIAATPVLGSRGDDLIADNRSVCDTNFILDYFRLSREKRLLFGGRCSYSTIEPANLPQTMQDRMVRVFPQLHDVSFDYVWGGYVAITINRFPDIGRTKDGIFYAQGFSGHGVALSQFSGKLIADAVNKNSESFDVFNRIKHKPFVGGRALRAPLLVLAMLYYRLRDLL